MAAVPCSEVWCLCGYSLDWPVAVLPAVKGSSSDFDAEVWDFEEVSSAEYGVRNGHRAC